MLLLVVFQNTICLEVIVRIKFDEIAFKLHFKNMTDFNLMKYQHVNQVCTARGWFLEIVFVLA